MDQYTLVKEAETETHGAENPKLSGTNCLLMRKAVGFLNQALQFPGAITIRHSSYFQGHALETAQLELLISCLLYLKQDRRYASYILR